MAVRIFSTIARRCLVLRALAVAGSLSALPLITGAAGPTALPQQGAGPAPLPSVSPPRRLVSLVPAITETLFALGLGDRVVGVSTACDWPPAAARLPKVGTFSDPVAEAIVALSPNLVLTSPSPGNEATVHAIERTGVKVAVVQSEGGLSEVREAVLGVAEVVGAGPRGRDLVAAIDARLEAVAAAARGLEHPSVAIVVGRDPLVLAGPASYLGELLTLAGGANIADKVGGRWPRAGIEFLVTSAPQVIVDLSVSMGEASASRDLAEAWSSLASVPAVSAGRVVGDRDSVMLRPGPRVAEAAETLFAAVHPGVALPAAARAAN